MIGESTERIANKYDTGRQDKAKQATSTKKQEKKQRQQGVRKS